MHFSGGKMPETVIDYLEKRQEGFYSMNSVEEEDADNEVSKSGEEEQEEDDKERPDASALHLFVLVWDSSRAKEAAIALEIFHQRALRRVVMLSGGI
jgi:hypothetical protein